jgi:hypothetical protein
MTGSLNWLSIAIRPNITATVNELSPANQGPSRTHQLLVKHLWRYLVGTKNLGIMLGGKVDTKQLNLYPIPILHLQIIHPREHRPLANVVFLGEGLVHWKSRK